MTRGKRLMPDEIDEIKRLMKDYTVKEIEDETGHSHTSIVKYTKDLRPSYSSSTPFTLSAKRTEMPAIPPTPLPQKKTNRTFPSGSYDPYQTPYYVGQNQDQYQLPRRLMDPSAINNSQNQYQQEIQEEEERKRREQRQRNEDQKKK